MTTTIGLPSFVSLHFQSVARMQPKRNTGNQRFECPVLRKLHTGYYKVLYLIENQSVNYPLVSE